MKVFKIKVTDPAFVGHMLLGSMVVENAMNQDAEVPGSSPTSAISYDIKQVTPSSLEFPLSVK